MARWRVARSLERLRDQVNERFPDRNRSSDGTIGDAAHAHRSRESDHNPWLKDSNGVGVVTALDLTHDLRAGLDTWAMAEHLRRGKDSRVKYIISNRRIFSSTTSPWNWRRYTGSNPHSQHMHISVRSTKAHYDDVSDWDLVWAISPTTPPEDPNLPDPDDPIRRLVLSRNSTGEDVKTVQRLLMLAQIDGIFGPITESAVRAFQQREKIRVDGIVGPLTWKALDSIEQVILPFNYAPPRELSEPE